MIITVIVIVIIVMSLDLWNYLQMSMITIPANPLIVIQRIWKKKTPRRDLKLKNEII